MIPISFIMPTRNNLEFLKLAYKSIRQNNGNDHEIIILVDEDKDGTVNWLRTLKDANLVIWENKTGNPLKHIVLYDIGVKLSKNDIFSIAHADMYYGPNYVKNLLKHLREDSVVCATRIEPPLHPAGREKIVMDFGMMPSQFKEKEFLDNIESLNDIYKNQTSSGMFAPWLMYKKKFLEIGGHDCSFYNNYEDSDIFQRFMLAGYELIQSMDSFVYHFTCRGNRWPDWNGIGQPTNSNEWVHLEWKSRRNYLRKWHTWIQTDEYLRPIVPKVYDIGFVVKNCDLPYLRELEIFCSAIYVDDKLIDSYIKMEQPHTCIDLKKRVKSINSNYTNSVIVMFDVNRFSSTPSPIGENRIEFLNKLSDIIADSAEVGTMEYDIFKFKINSTRSMEKQLIMNVNIHSEVKKIK